MGWQDAPVDETPSPRGAKWQSAPIEAGRDVTMTESALRGVAQGFTFGFADEIAGGWDALTSDKTYEQGRDESRAAFDAAQKANPKTYFAGELAGGLAVPIPGAGAAKGATMAARLAKASLTGAGMGAAYGLGSSEGTTAGEMLRDTLTGGAFGLAGGTVGGAIGEGLNKIAGRAGRGVGQAVSDAEQAAARKAEQAYNSAHGAYRSGIQSASRDLEVLERIAQGSDDLAREAQDLLSGDAGQQLRELVGRGKLQTAPQRMAEAAQLKEAAELARAGMSPDAVSAAAQESLANPISTQIIPRVKTWANRAIPMAVGATVGGPTGVAVGSMVANAIGRPTTAMAKAVQSPAVRNMSWGFVLKLLGENPQAFGRYSRPLLKAAERGAQSFAVTNAVLAQRDPEYQQLLEALASREQ